MLQFRVRKYESVNMFKFEDKIMNRSGTVEISVQNVKSFKMLQFKIKISCWISWCNLSENASLRTKLEIDQSVDRNLPAKCQVDQNVAIWVKKYGSVKMLKFEDKFMNRSNCWNFGAKCQIDQNVTVWDDISCWTKWCNLSEHLNVAIQRQN